MPDDALHATLLRINRYGPPSLCRTQRGWWCYVSLGVSVAGVTFEVKSESEHSDPLDAAKECEQRIDVALRAMGVPASQPPLSITSPS